MNFNDARKILFLGITVLFARLASAQPGTVAGELSVEPPTLVSLGFDWKIEGDDNRNANVDVSFRRKGEQTWRPGLPLLRLQHEQVNGRVGGPSFTDAAHAAENAAAIARSTPSPSPPVAGGTGGRGAAAGTGGAGGRGGGGVETGPFAFSPFSYTAPNMFSGSIFDLEPDTEYEVRLVLSDPDGVKGEAQRT
ncbi:MAG TPA: hypothetical protein VNZ26_18410, partial [Vicinamibacterales bacterium]|nr:hypothetical protein [Vicinamibacterales bacterium]